MKYRRLGKSELKVSVIGMGTWQFGGEWDKAFTQEEVDGMFDTAREVGINLIDTAECYGDHLSEAFIGAATRRDRGNWIIATKFGHQYEERFQRSEPRSPADVARQVEDSLRALKTDYIDLLQFHSWGDSDFANDAVRRKCIELVESGKVRHLGNSIGPNDKTQQVEQSEHYRVEVIQLIHNRLNHKGEAAVLPLCRRLDLGVLARVPLASSFLTGKYKPGAQFPPEDTRSRWTQEQRDGFIRQAMEVQRTEVPAGVPMAQWAIAWCLQNPAITAVIPGCKNAAQVAKNALAADMEMVPTDHPLAV
jgi:aryl-alcohol dehydrogenase-like predicted oxidoreductase